MKDGGKPFRYILNTPYKRDQLPCGATSYELFKNGSFIGGYGLVEYIHPLSGGDVDHYNLDGPLVVGGYTVYGYR